MAKHVKERITYDKKDCGLDCPFLTEIKNGGGKYNLCILYNTIVKKEMKTKREGKCDLRQVTSERCILCIEDFGTRKKKEGNHA